MQIPEWFKPAASGVVAGAVGFAVIGFSADWIVTSGSAAQMARSDSEKAVLAALTPVCVAQFGLETETSRAEHLAALQKESTYKRSDYVETQGWATMPGTEAADAKVAKTCATELLKLSAS
jgi:hypothetical protein